MMKKILLALAGLLLLFLAYVVLVPQLQVNKNSVIEAEKRAKERAERDRIALEIAESENSITYYAPEEIPPEIITTGNDKITNVSIGDKEEHKAIDVRSHVYTVIHAKDDLEKLEYTLSYVILPRNLSGHSNKVTAVYQRYAQVLEQIQELRKISKSNVVQKSAPFPRTDNHFVLFKKGEDESKVTIDNYNYELSYKVLDFFQAKYPDVRLDKEGPYIITTARNVMNGVEDFSFLYMNLSSFNNSAVKEAIESYKKRLVDKGNSDIERLEGWKYSLLSALTNFNADIHIVRSAVAGEL